MGQVSTTIVTRGAKRKYNGSRFRLAANQIDVWHCAPGKLGRAGIAAALRALSPLERERYRRMRSPEGKLNFLAGRALARNVLGLYGSSPACKMEFAVDASGRPFIAAPRALRDMHFSLSHTSGLVVMAVAPIPEIGIDVEKSDRPIDISDVAPLVFTQSELEPLSRSSPGQARAHFFNLWTLKEAYLKARGMGFALPPRSFEFTGATDRLSLRCDAACDDNPGRWRFALSAHRSDIQMALAIGSRSITQIRHRAWQPCARSAGHGLR